MSKHRRNPRYRKIAVTVAAVAAVGTTSAAMACVDWEGGKENGSYNWKWENTSRDRGEKDWSAPAPTTAPSQTAFPEQKPSAWQTPASPQTSSPSRSASASPTTAPSQTSSPSRTATPPPAASPSRTASPSWTASPSQTATTPPGTTPSQTATASPSPTSTGVTARVVELVNLERAKVGCSPVTVNAKLTKAAQAHSADMAANQTMSHTGSNGSSAGDRIENAGYAYRSYGENVAYGYSTPEKVMAGWMSSEGHKRNILNCGFKEIGVGLAQPGNYWTQDFATAG